MAENKNGFILYADLIKVVSKLPDDVAGKLFKIILNYVNDKEVSIDDLLLEIAFEPIKQQLKRDLVKWESSSKKKSDNGRIGNLKKYNKDLYELVLADKMTILEAESIAKHRKATKTVANVAVTDTVTVTVTDTVTEEDILLKKESKEKKFDFKKSMLDYGFEPTLVSDWMLIRQKKKAVNSEKAFKDFIAEVEKCNKPPNELLDMIVKKQWKGFESNWLKNINENFNGNDNTKSITSAGKSAGALKLAHALASQSEGLNN